MLAKHTLLATIAFGALLVACSKKDSDTGAMDTTPGASAAASPAPSGGEYTPGEMLGILKTVSEGDIESGALAQTKATDAQVKQLAARLAADHQAMKQDIDELSAKLSLTPTMPKHDGDIGEDHREAMGKLNSKAAGREWDEKYLEHEISMHKKAVDETEEAAKKEQNPEMKAMLEKALAGLKGHLEAAQRLEKKFGV